VRTKRRAYC